MMNKRRMFKELKRRLKNVRFEKLCSVAEAFGFRFRGGEGSHRIYVRDGVQEIFMRVRLSNPSLHQPLPLNIRIASLTEINVV